jgi:serine/threonine protein kinase
MGIVFEAEDVHLRRQVALKVMRPALASSESARQRFLREARAAAGVKHDHVVTIYQVGQENGVPFLAMEYLEGEPLDKRLARGRLPIPKIMQIGREIAQGLAAAHERGLVHRDIKPANIWLEGETGRVKILDFGLARPVNEDVRLTQTGAVLGTPLFMAPEQAGGKSVDARSDLFSLGCVLYLLCTGRSPFTGGDLISILFAVATEQPQPPRDLNPEVPSRLSELVVQLLAKLPAGRPSSARTVAEAIRAMESETLQPNRPDLFPATALVPSAESPYPPVLAQQVSRPLDDTALLRAPSRPAAKAGRPALKEPEGPFFRAAGCAGALAGTLLLAVAITVVWFAYGALDADVVTGMLLGGAVLGYVLGSFAAGMYFGYHSAKKSGLRSKGPATPTPAVKRVGSSLGPQEQAD